jgi:hypothetical protein
LGPLKCTSAAENRIPTVAKTVTLRFRLRVLCVLHKRCRSDYAIRWVRSRQPDKPFFLYLSHKAVHSDFVPADRHRGKYDAEQFAPPATFPETPANYRDKPMWLKNQRNSGHGVDFAYNLDRFDLGAYYKRYCETLLAVDENLGRLLDCLEQRGLDSRTPLDAVPAVAAPWFAGAAGGGQYRHCPHAARRGGGSARGRDGRAKLPTAGPRRGDAAETRSRPTFPLRHRDRAEQAPLPDSFFAD